jgi:hypothetical protein
MFLSNNRAHIQIRGNCTEPRLQGHSLHGTTTFELIFRKPQLLNQSPTHNPNIFFSLNLTLKLTECGLHVRSDMAIQSNMAHQIALHSTPVHQFELNLSLFTVGISTHHPTVGGNGGQSNFNAWQRRQWGQRWRERYNGDGVEPEGTASPEPLHNHPRRWRQWQRVQIDDIKVAKYYKTTKAMKHLCSS